MGTIFGPVVGAVLVVLMKNVASAYVHRWIMLLGFSFLVIVLFVPGGIVPGFTRLARSLERRKRTSTAPPSSSTTPHAAKEAP